MKGHREKLSITVDPLLYRVVTRHAKRTKVPTSKVVEEAIRVWERTRLAALAREGYQKMANANLQDAEAYLSVLDELMEE